MSEKDKEKKPIGSRSAMWCEYLRNFQHNRLTDKALITTIKEIVFCKEPLRCLLTTVRAGRRVFKQQCLKREIPYHVHCTLLGIDEADLAFNVVLSHGVWKDAVKIFANEGVTRKSRDAAVKKAVQQCRWKEIMLMVETMPSGCAVNSRAVFQEMVRWGKLRLAVELLEKDVSVTDGDLNFAIRACLRLDQLDCVLEFVKRMTSLDEHRTLLTRIRIVEEIITVGKLDSLLEVATYNWRKFCDNRKFLKSLFKVLMRLQQGDFVFEFCQSVEEKWYLSYEIWEIANESAIETCQWQVVKQDILTYKQFGLCLKKCLKKRTERSKICTFLENWCTQEENFEDYDDMPSLVRAIEPIFHNTTSGLIDWLSQESLFNLGFIVSLATGNATKLTRYLEKYGSSIDKCRLLDCIQTMLDDLDTDAAAEILRYLSVEDFDSWYLCECLYSDSLIETCREKGLTEWTVHLAILVDKWEVVKSVMTEHDDIPLSLIDLVIVQACEEEEWQLVQTLTDRCSQSPGTLFKVLQCGISNGEGDETNPGDAMDIRRSILESVDPCLARRFLNGTSLLQIAVVSSGDREKMVRFCIGSGVSTHEQPSGQALHDSAMKTALWNGQLPLVQLLYMSGATSNEELHRLKSDKNLRTRLQGQGRTDIVSYLDHAASTPMTLQDLCRLRVSHLVGCLPGRNDRIESLPLTTITKDLVRFRDIL
ncbi:uncharacterized protein [Littorina saxatilis]|uniref:SOCS box domain-containing protein n=1 Tax=Littorina saxatilis TaxID=31220 RepID=A0AAN9APT7_9CAEN